MKICTWIIPDVECYTPKEKEEANVMMLVDRSVTLRVKEDIDLVQFIKAWRHINALMNLDIIGSVHGLLPVWKEIRNHFSRKFTIHAIYKRTHAVFSCDQAALWMVFSVCPSVSLSVCPSVRLSVCLSVCLSLCLSVSLSLCLSLCLSITPFWLCSHHRIIMKFSGVITKD